MLIILSAAMISRDNTNDSKDRSAAERRTGETPVERRAVESATLLAGGKELLIRHGAEVYTLRQTSKGKLILTK